MGSYVYKVSTKARDYGGVKIHVASYAYKPYFFGGDTERLNRRAAFASGCFSIGAAWLKLGNPGCLYVGSFNGKIDNGAAVREAPPGFNGIFWDDDNRHEIVGYLVDGKYVSAVELNVTCQTKTAFRYFSELFTTHVTYRPSLDMRQPDLVKLADAYDAVQESRGDKRRAYRYGAQSNPPEPRGEQPGLSDNV